MKVSELVEGLFERYPQSWAEPWDHVGLACGDPDARVERVALALDATPQTVREAADFDAQVLLTHHPVYLKAPTTFSPPSRQTPSAASCMWEALTKGVALVAMHTNLDRSDDATGRLPRLLGLEPECGIELGGRPGEGSLGSVASLEHGLTVDGLARRCLGKFGRVAQVYGSPDAPVRRAAFFNGSLGDNGEDALAAGADVVVCGECGYHRALDLLTRGCAVIILGHDTSETPLVGVLEERVMELGVSPKNLLCLGTEPLWHSVDG